MCTGTPHNRFNQRVPVPMGFGGLKQPDSNEAVWVVHQMLAVSFQDQRFIGLPHSYNFFLVMRTFKIYSLSNFEIDNIGNYSHHAIRYRPRTDL